MLPGLLMLAVPDSLEARDKLPDPNDEYIIITGGPALLRWENCRLEQQLKQPLVSGCTSQVSEALTLVHA